MRTLRGLGTWAGVAIAIGVVSTVGPWADAQDAPKECIGPPANNDPLVEEQPASCVVTLATSETCLPPQLRVTEVYCKPQILKFGDHGCNGQPGTCNQPVPCGPAPWKRTQEATPSLVVGACVSEPPACTCEVNGTVVWTYGRPKCQCP